jgi:UDP-4-amino-4-deoxy-L-arabinose formyltransferase/UDP-glucuronic acid dehydrogenase (UDP-4-keto-hexauronic acid decarboxylating)
MRAISWRSKSGYDADETALQLHHKLCALRKPAARCAAFHPHGTFKETAQDESKASCFGRRTPEDGRLDWTNLRASCTTWCAVTDPWPGAYSFAGVSKFIVWKSRVRDDIPAAKPGTVVSVSRWW